MAAALFPILAFGLASCGSAAVEGLPCRAVAGSVTYSLDNEQAGNATTIAAVGVRLGLPDHAVTIALAAALQESKLYNLPYGDQDSLGLFQQRPSEGWGTPAEIMTPSYAAAAFFTHLARVTNWETLPVSAAAQAVQHSADGDAYAQWETESRVLAQALTGEVPASFSCRTDGAPVAPSQPVALAAALAAAAGPPALGMPVSAPRGWLVAAWLVAHANQYGVATVTFAGMRWSGHNGKWVAHSPATDIVQINQ